MSWVRIPGIQRLLWTRITWRHACGAPWSTALLILTLALGVAVFLAIRLANRAAVASFQNFADVVTAESDGILSAPAGSLPESVLAELRSAFPDTPVHWIPIVEGGGVEPGDGESPLAGGRVAYQLLGVDWIAIQNLVGARGAGRITETGTTSVGSQANGSPASDGGFWDRFRDPRAVLVSASLASTLKSPTLRLVVQEQVVDLHVAGTFPETPSGPRVPSSLLLMDLPALQSLLGRAGRVDRIEFVLPSGPDHAGRLATLRQELQTLARGRWVVGTSAERRENAATMTQAFRLNLSILSLLALLVGLLLVFQALDGAVVRRREEIAILRSLGIEPERIRRAWLLEAAVLGIIGGLLGILLGWIGAQSAVRAVGQTVNSLYYATAVRSAALDPVESVAALGIAVLASLVAGWWPARLAASTPPAQLMGRGRAQTGGVAPAWVMPASLGLLGLGALMACLPAVRLAGGSRISAAAYVTALVWLLGFGLLGGLMPPWLLGALSTWGGLSAPWRLALSHLRRPTGRHRLAIAGLVCAVSMTAAMAILVGSFDTTLRAWIERTFMADLYVSSEGAQSASSPNRIRPETWKALAADPAVEAVNVIQSVELQLPGGSTLLFGGNLRFMHEQARIAWRQPPTDESVWNPVRNGELALASESFSERFQLRRGDWVVLPTPSGERRVRIAGVFSDYGNERGSLVIQRERFSDWFGEELAGSLIAKLRDPAAADAVRVRWRSLYPGLAVYTQPHLRAEALRIFRQTFAITDALEVIGIAVSVLGLGFTLASLLLERREELTTLRALGVRHGELALATAVESVLTALIGVVVGLGSSFALGWLLIHRVNFQTFGWTLETDPPWGWLGGLGLAVLLMAAATGWSIGRWGASLPAEREE
jgi:putative ABC transport system permease protein